MAVRSRRFGAVAAFFAALLAFVSIAHAAAHVPAASDAAVSCAVCETPAVEAAPAATTCLLLEAPDALEVVRERAPVVAHADRASARGPPRS